MTNILCVVIECLCVILEYICKNCTGQVVPSMGKVLLGESFTVKAY